ncbi:MAG: drug/metabolite transporter (DMT)-like permease [Pseudohongiellaceae bacterium]|jgi:drug/metabolite transporter (DMT)-like permease
MPHTKNIITQLHISALLLGGTALFSKLIPYSAIDIISYRTLICGLLVLGIALALKHKILIKNKFHLMLLIFCSLLFTLHWTAYFHSMQISSVAVGIVSMFTFPVITVFLEPLIKKTRIHIIDIVMAVIVLFGVSLIVPEFSLSNNITAGVAFGVLSGFAVALRNVIVSKWLTQYSAFTIMTFHSLISALVLLPFTTVAAGSISSYEWFLLILLGSVFTAIPHTQKTYALLHKSAKTVSMIISLQVVYATIFAFLLLGEYVEFNTLVGGSLILFAAVFESIKAKKTKN